MTCLGSELKISEALKDSHPSQDVAAERKTPNCMHFYPFVVNCSDLTEKNYKLERMTLELYFFLSQGDLILSLISSGFNMQEYLIFEP